MAPTVKMALAVAVEQGRALAGCYFWTWNTLWQAHLSPALVGALAIHWRRRLIHWRLPLVTCSLHERRGRSLLSPPPSPPPRRPPPGPGWYLAAVLLCEGTPSAWRRPDHGITASLLLLLLPHLFLPLLLRLLLLLAMPLLLLLLLLLPLSNVWRPQLGTAR